LRSRIIMQARNVYLPHNLDLEVILQENLPDFKFEIDNFKYLLSLIYEIPSYDRESKDQQEFTSLYGRYLQKKVHGYKKYLTYLIENGVLETDGHYIKGKKSIGYRFTDEFSTPVRVDKITKSSLVTSWREEGDDSVRGYAYLTRWFDEKLRIDSDAAVAVLKAEYGDQMKAGDITALRKFNSAFVAVQRLANKDFYMSVDTTSRRFHSNLSNLTSLCRKHVTYDGRKLVSIDIVNSQPLFSGAILNPRFYERKNRGQTADFLDLRNHELRRFFEGLAVREMKELMGASKPLNFNILKVCPDNISNQEIINNNSPLRVEGYVQSPDYQASMDSEVGAPLKRLEYQLNNLVDPHPPRPLTDIEGYLKLVECGKIYEAIKDHILASGDQETINKIHDRKSLKQVVFLVLFSDNRYIADIKALPKRVFKEMFPGVYEVFASLKRKKDKARLAKLLQTIESVIVLKRIAKRISRERPDVPIFTVHDSIVCPEGNEEYVKQVLSEEVIKAIGIRPSLRVEPWS
jgi:hypothetical protein